METRFRWRSGWRFVVAAHPPPSRFATARIRRLGFKRRKKQFPNPPKAKARKQLTYCHRTQCRERVLYFNENSLFARYRSRSLDRGFAESVWRRTVAADAEETSYG